MYEFRYLHHCNSYHLKSRKNDSYMMHACVLNNGPYKHPKSWKNTNIMNIQKKENNFLQKKKETLRHQYFQRFEVRFKMKTMFFFILENQTSLLFIWIINHFKNTLVSLSLIYLFESASKPIIILSVMEVGFLRWNNTS